MPDPERILQLFPHQVPTIFPLVHLMQEGDKTRKPTLFALGGRKKPRLDGYALSEKARKMYNEGKQRPKQTEETGPSIQQASTHQTSSHEALGKASLTSIVKEAPRFGLNGKALIMQAAAEAAASFIPIRQPKGVSTSCPLIRYLHTHMTAKGESYLYH